MTEDRLVLAELLEKAGDGFQLFLGQCHIDEFPDNSLRIDQKHIR